jgi:hypothetical protein
MASAQELILEGDRFFNFINVKSEKYYVRTSKISVLMRTDVLDKIEDFQRDYCYWH